MEQMRSLTAELHVSVDHSYVQSMADQLICQILTPVSTENLARFPRDTVDLIDLAQDSLQFGAQLAAHNLRLKNRTRWSYTGRLKTDRLFSWDRILSWKHMIRGCQAMVSKSPCQGLAGLDPRYGRVLEGGPHHPQL